MLSSQLLNRLRRELEMLEHDPPPGIVCYPVNDNCTHLEAHIKGPVDSPFENGTFKLDIEIPQRYPFDPPQMRFLTPIYHPNIDEAGRICADILKMPPAGSWKPALNLSTVLMALSGLISDPNPDDPLEIDIAAEYKDNIALFRHKAQQMTMKHAVNGSSSSQATVSNSSALRSEAAESSSSGSSQIPSKRELEQESELKAVIAPVVASKKMSKMSLSKPKVDGKKQLNSPNQSQAEENSLKHEVRPTNTKITSKYFMGKLSKDKAYHKITQLQADDNNEKENGRVREVHGERKAEPMVMNSNDSSSDIPDLTTPSISSCISEGNSTISNPDSSLLNGRTIRHIPLVPIPQSIKSHPQLPTGNLDDITAIPQSPTANLDDITPIPHAPTSAGGTEPSLANAGKCAKKNDPKLSNISNCIEATLIDLEAPVVKRPSKRSLLSLGKSKKLKM